jgi:ABC-type transport system substrate-binding protein
LALVGEVTGANVWSLFDTSGYSYNDYAVRSGYWPRLFDLTIPDYRFEAQAASGDPTPVRQEGDLYTATVTLRSDLKWTDGSPFTAEDVAFTVNAALAFHLTFDWEDYYNPAWLDHAEAPDLHAVKFFFRQMPGVGVWHYGVLQGPAVQDKFWSSKVSQASTMLPGADLVAQIEALKVKVASLEAQLGVLNYGAATNQGEEARQAQSGLKRQQGDLDQALNDLTKAQDSYDSALNAARAALFGLSDRGEPLLGAWTATQPAAATSSTLENKANPGYPGPAAHFDRAVYQFYPTREAAESAQQAGKVDVVLDPTSSVAPALDSAGAAPAGTMKSPTRSVRFLVINPQSSTWSRRPLRQALACMLDQEELAGSLGGKAIALTSYVVPQESTWYNPDAALPCQGLTPPARLAQAVQMLKTAGFAWAQEPSSEVEGTGLSSADGKSVPTVDLLVPTSDPLRVAAGNYIQQQARQLGIPLSARPVGTDTVDFAVFSNHEYDMAVLGWKVSLYPGYLCDWFGAGKPFQYQRSSVVSACGVLNVTNGTDQAAQQVFEIQAALAQDVPFIPLYSEAIYDSPARVTYPFSEVLGGLAEVYGAPNLALPASP